MSSLGEVTVTAQNLGRNRGWHVFPVRMDKSPATPNGFKDAAADPRLIAKLWRNHPAPLIGVATGAVSGIDVLDIDAGEWRDDASPELIAKHETARAWWKQHVHRLPGTRTYRSRSHGLHLFFHHAPNVGGTQGKIALGVDTRGDGGYIVFWFAAGAACLDHAAIVPWPTWILGELFARPRPPPIPSRVLSGDYRERAVNGILRSVTDAPEGQRNGLLYWAACRLGEQARSGLLDAGEAEALLMNAAITAGLDEREARLTARSGLRTTAA